MRHTETYRVRFVGQKVTAVGRRWLLGTGHTTCTASPAVSQSVTLSKGATCTLRPKVVTSCGPVILFLGEQIWLKWSPGPVSLEKAPSWWRGTHNPCATARATGLVGRGWIPLKEKSCLGRVARTICQKGQGVLGRWPQQGSSPFQVVSPLTWICAPKVYCTLHITPAQARGALQPWQGHGMVTLKVLGLNSVFVLLCSFPMTLLTWSSAVYPASW